MRDAPVKSPLTRDGWFVGGALLLVVMFCLSWVVTMAVDMYGRMSGAAAWMMTAHWDWRHVGLLFSMWSAMMVAMMSPSEVPTLLQYARSVPVESEDARPASRISACAAGYVFVWMLFSAAATIGQRAMTEAHWLTPMMEPAMPGLAGGLLLGAGLYQFLPVKHACLTSCRSAAACVEGPRTGVIEAFRIGARHAALTLIVLFEKVAPFGMRSTSLSGGLLIGLGLWVIAH